MRNQYPGSCYRCSKWVPAGEGHFELFRGQFRVQHATCAIEHRGSPDPERERFRLARLKLSADLTGRKGQRARAELRRIADEQARVTAPSPSDGEGAQEACAASDHLEGQ